MKCPEIIELKNIDDLDVEDVFFKIQKSYKIKVGRAEFKQVTTFGDLCDLVLSKLTWNNVQDCTSQQAFYKLREAICDVQGINRDNVSLTTNLQTLFPKSSRRKQIGVLENSLGFSLNILRPKYWIGVPLLIVFLVSLVCLYFSWMIGFTGIVLVIGGFYFSNFFGREMDTETVRDLVKKITREHYLLSRRNGYTVNKKEVIENIRNLFAHDLDLDPEVLTSDATFS